MTRGTSGIARGLLAAVLLLAALETAIGIGVFRNRIEGEDWATARAALAKYAGDEPVLLGNRWLGPRARMEIPALRRWIAVAPPDLRGLPSFWVLGLDTEWSPQLQQDLEGLPAPRLTQQTSAGAFTLARYEQPAAGTLRWDLTDPVAASRLEVSVDGKPCRGKAGLWSCGRGQVQLRVEEVDFRPRRCLAVELPDGARLRLHLPDAAMGDVVRGHVGLADFNGRLRSDVPVGVTIVVDQRYRTDFVVTDDDDWAPLAVATPPGTHDLTIEVQLGASGTWHDGQYRPERRRVPCLEFRSLQEAHP